MTEDTGQTLDLELAQHYPDDQLDPGDQGDPGGKQGDENETAAGPADTAPSEATTRESTPSRTMILTNRFNLLICLGARLIQPRSAYRKYYPDPLDQAPGAVPLLDRAPSESMLEELRKGSSFPVLIELGSLGGLEIVQPTDSARVVAGAIPLRRAIAVHFPDERALRDHKARPYSNVEPQDDLLKVTPDLFNTGATTTSWTSHNIDVPERDWRRVDRLRGAANGARIGASSPRTLEAVVRSLGVTPEGVEKSAAPWLDGLLDFGSRRGRSADDILFAASIEVLMDTDTKEDWSPRSVIAAIEKRATANANKRTTATIESNVEYARLVLMGDKEFTPFKPKSTGLTTAKALLLVLLRENLGSLVDWPSSETGADDITIQTAAVYAGALRGLSREESTLRNTAFDDLTAEWAATGHGPIERSRLRSTTDAEGSTLYIGDTVARYVPKPPPLPSELLERLSGDDLNRAGIELCKLFGWRDLVTTKAVWSGQVVVQARAGKTVVTGELVDFNEDAQIDLLGARLDEEEGGRDAVLKVLGESSHPRESTNGVV